ncbi:Unknown protein [Striga hermonthica]|uniref:Uncharacterized protein n=1 Tax=Striga hermonthica TaxID=68872 RepID=A0A9N7N0L7_STRHE|nr:Unknown protein [Striga hermonthica]
MEQSSFGSELHDEPDDFSLREWALKAKISRENTNSRRFYASNFKSFRENQTSFRSNVAISSVVSSPGYTVRDEINPSTYSFTNALKALQARRMYSNTWEYVSADNGGLTLNSKWNDAEKYICNPVSGQVPLQCLSSKALSERSSQSLVTSRIKQVPLVNAEKKRNTTRHVGTQIKFSSESPNIPSRIPSCEEKSAKPSEQEESRGTPVNSKIQKSEAKLGQKVQEKETEDKRIEKKTIKKETTNTCSHGRKEKGCLSFINVWRHKTRNRNNNANLSIFLCHVNASFHQ